MSHEELRRALTSLNEPVPQHLLPTSPSSPKSPHGLLPSPGSPVRVNSGPHPGKVLFTEFVRLAIGSASPLSPQQSVWQKFQEWTRRSVFDITTLDNQVNLSVLC